MRFLIFCGLFFGVLGTVLAQTEPVLVADLTFTVPGTQAVIAWEKTNPEKDFRWPDYFYGFQQEDVIQIDLKVAEGKAAYEFEVREYGSGSVIYAARNLNKVKRLQLTVPKKTVYQFIVRSNAPEKSTCKLTIKRVPASVTTRAFNANVTWKTKTDTAYTFVNEKVKVAGSLQPQVITDKVIRVFAQASIGNPSRIVIPFKIPVTAKHWVYWIGVGQESVKELEETAKTMAKGGAAVLSGISPVAAFGMGLLPQLPVVKSSGYVNYLFMNQAAATAFEKEGTRKPVNLPQANAVVSDYGKITAAQTPKITDGTLYLGIENKNTVTGLDVAVKIISFEPEEKYEMRRVKKPGKITQTRIPVFGE